MNNPTNLERFKGCLIGLAVGDALGTTLEFQPPGTFTPIFDLIGGGPFHLKPGQWTDDTSMALCLAESLINCRGFDPADQIERYVRWYQEGHLSSTGHCFDIGNTTRQALELFKQTRQPFCGVNDPNSAGNGSLMRLAPIPMFFVLEAQKAIHYSGESSRTTHGARSAIDACRYFGGLLAAALCGENKEALLSELYSPILGFWEDYALHPSIEMVARGSFKLRQPPQIRGTGYVVESLEAALWAFYHSRSFEEGSLLAVNLGDDADTTGAIFGQIAGAYYGLNDIPESWLEKLAHRDLILMLADDLFELSGTDRKN